MENRDIIKGVIFDLDGVIVHTDEFHYLAWKQLADKIGVYFDRTINERLRGVSRMASLDIILERSDAAFSDTEKQLLADEKNDTYRELLKTLTPADVSADVKSTLAALRQNGLKLAIGSSSKNARFILNQIGLENYFDAISDGNNISKSKPDPEVFLKAAEYLCLKSEQCIVVEDAEAGIQAAKNGGFTAAGIGGASKYNLTDISLNLLSDLLKYV
ncbi:MAG: beta-phosphoglucomutase [Clostridia bacterium]|nr:beta-phosphoglucomutase [Clostridia bacterium]